MKALLTSMLATAFIAAVPALASAATFQYITINGEVKSVTADTALEAMVKPIDIAPTSGVLLVTDESKISSGIKVSM